MSLYSNVVDSLNENDTIELYRFQGGYSSMQLSIRNQSIENSKKRYAYFSSSLNHHKYFMIKRIRQLLDEEVLKEENLSISFLSLINNEQYSQIRSLIINTDKLVDMYSTRLVCLKSVQDLLKENSYIQREKVTPNSIERVDRRIYGGGYGLSTHWRRLVDLLTYFKSSQRIDRQAILELISNMRRTGAITKKDNINFLVSKIEKYCFEINKQLESDFTKYEIIECLERIIENGDYNPNSNFGQKKSETIKQIVTDYESGKNKTLRLLSKYSEIK